MVKCPRGTPQQINANLNYLRSLTEVTCANNVTNSKGDLVCKQQDEEEQVESVEVDYADVIELDEVRADKRRPPTTEDEITYLFVNQFLDILLKSWDGTPCLKPKLGPEPEDVKSKEDNDQNEETGSFDISVDHLNEIYKSRPQHSKETIPEDRLSATCKISESRNLTGEGIESEYSWRETVPDEDVTMSFQNGAWYSGRVSRRLMDGEGTFFWEDGGSFQGEFVGGTATGFGRLEFPDLSVYEGGVYRGFRHGIGLHCISHSPVMYSGEWWLGKKNGDGVIFYDDPAVCLNFYKGSWANGVKDGFGYRQYPTGSKYIGYWQNGRRHGTGIMFWSNNDIYRGEWKNGRMDGFGEYVWNGFINKTFSYPRVNTHRGYWDSGRRNGPGVLELSNGAFIETVWVDNEKDGPGAVICSNGALFISGKKLFRKDKPALLNDEEKDLIGLLFRNYGFQMTRKKNSKNAPKLPDEGQLMAFMSSMEKAKAHSIPIHTPVQSLELSVHVKRLQDQRNEFYIKQTEQMSAFSLKNTPRIESINETKPNNAQHELTPSAEVFTSEEKLLRYSILTNLNQLKACYEEWAIIACSEKPPFDCSLIRIFFWELLTEAQVPARNLSLIDVDVILAKEESWMVDMPHDPFERIQFWQFIHFLVTISWYLYGQYVYADVTTPRSQVDAFLKEFYDQNEKAVLSSAFIYFLQNHIYRIDKDSSGRELLRNRDLVPMEPMYIVYKIVGEPHSAKKFLTTVCGSKGMDCVDCSPHVTYYIEKLPEYKLTGRNAITFTNELSYLPSDSPFNHPEIYPLEEGNADSPEISELSLFAHLTPKGIVKCLVKVCPNIMDDGLIVDMEYQLTFLEFYKVIIACAESSLKRKALKEMKSQIIETFKKEIEEYERRLREFEKQKEASMLVAKKPSMMKKAKK